MRGRDREQEIALGFVRDGASRHGGVLLIEGEPGIGKSGLLRDGRRRGGPAGVLPRRGGRGRAGPGGAVCPAAVGTARIVRPAAGRGQLRRPGAGGHLAGGQVPRSAGTARRGSSGAGQPGRPALGRPGHAGRAPCAAQPAGRLSAGLAADPEHRGAGQRRRAAVRPAGAGRRGPGNARPAQRRRGRRGGRRRAARDAGCRADRAGRRGRRQSVPAGGALNWAPRGRRHPGRPGAGHAGSRPGCRTGCRWPCGPGSVA